MHYSESAKKLIRRYLALPYYLYCLRLAALYQFFITFAIFSLRCGQMRASRPRSQNACLKDFAVFQTGILMSVNQQFYTTHLPIQKREKITPNKSSALNSPVISLHANCASRRCSANSSI